MRCSPHLWWNYFDLQIIDVKLTSLLTVGKLYVKKSLQKNSLSQIFYNFFLVFFPWFLNSDVQRGGLDLCRLKHEMSDFCKESCIYEICTDIFHFNTKRRKRRKRRKRQKKTQCTFLQHLSRRLKIHSIRAWRTWSWVSSRLVPFGEPLCSRIPALAKILSNARK